MVMAVAKDMAMWEEAKEVGGTEAHLGEVRQEAMVVAGRATEAEVTEAGGLEMAAVVMVMEAREEDALEVVEGPAAHLRALSAVGWEVGVRAVA